MIPKVNHGAGRLWQRKNFCNKQNFFSVASYLEHVMVLVFLTISFMC